MKMKKKKKNKKIKKEKKRKILPDTLKRWIFSLLLFLVSVILILSFFKAAGKGGEILFRGFYFILGKAIFLLPFVLILSALFTLWGITSFRKKWPQIFLVLLFLVIGISGMISSISLDKKSGGYIGYIVTFFVLNFFNKIVSFLVFFVIFLIGVLILIYPFSDRLKLIFFKKEKEKIPEKEVKEKAVFKKKEILKKPIFKEPVKITIPLKKKEREIEKERKILQISSFKFPPLSLLEREKGRPDSGDIKSNSLLIKRTLENFGIPVEVEEVKIGPTVTQYAVKPAEGIKLSKITALSSNLALALAAHPIRIEAPIPGKSLVGIEVPNKERVKVRLRDLLENPFFQQSPKPLLFTIGKDVSGEPLYADLGKMPHLLVAGSTGSGKTIFLNSLIISFLYKNPPWRLKFILIDPKRVEFNVYSGLPHLLCPVILDVNKVVASLKWLVMEMERRFDLLSEFKARNIESFNKLIERKNKNSKEKIPYLPYIVLIIDELADLMVAKGREIESFIVRIAQMARAVGIHLVVATQRPSVEIITGLIKANITSRIAFQVASQVDSRTILDMAGAEKLLGEGDLLFLSSDTSKPKRAQGAFVSEREVKRVIDFIKSQSLEKKETEKELEQGLKEALTKEEEEKNLVYFEGEDPLYEKAKEIVIQQRKASASLLQRKLRIGYARAARLIDLLEERGVVGPQEGAKPREVYLTQEDLEKENLNENDNLNETENNLK